MSDAADAGVGPRRSVRPTPRSRRAIFLLSDGVFAGTLPGPGRAGTRIGSLAAYLEGLLARHSPRGALLGGVLGEARSYGLQLPVLRFCARQLLPFLRTSAGRPREVGGAGPPISDSELQGLERTALELQQQLDPPRPLPESAEALLALVGAPCAVVGSAVVPLSPVTGASASGSVITAGGKRYALQGVPARPLAALLRAVREEQQRCAEQRLRSRPELVAAAEEFVREMRAALARFHPRRCGGHELFHRDGVHQLQHSHGHWILVRGPVATRMVPGNIFVGLPLLGVKRSDWLAVPPRAAADEGAFWGSDGRPLIGGTCMGSRLQYQRLLRDEFTDAEAVTEWLDAGVIVATGRSAQHRKRRAARPLLIHGCRIAE